MTSIHSVILPVGDPGVCRFRYQEDPCGPVRGEGRVSRRLDGGNVIRHATDGARPRSASKAVRMSTSHVRRKDLVKTG